eukprot:6493411-Lingulodinium_polyedra.AAC.1
MRELGPGEAAALQDGPPTSGATSGRTGAPALGIGAAAEPRARHVRQIGPGEAAASCVVPLPGGMAV